MPMTVGKLRELLAYLPSDMPVLIDIDDYSTMNTRDITHVVTIPTPDSSKQQLVLDADWGRVVPKEVVRIIYNIEQEAE